MNPQKELFLWKLNWKEPIKAIFFFLKKGNKEKAYLGVVELLVKFYQGREGSYKDPKDSIFKLLHKCFQVLG